ncbi:MAG: hypothetical protein A2Y56_02225 [Candidatus Aminicenantes bacterium RBG_13_63_10]|nr:MAG: hypothetical protein A2Y56_02225 [Candidatus Aminicenantes bacterium RBG_13_63_10]
MPDQVVVPAIPLRPWVKRYPEKVWSWEVNEFESLKSTWKLTLCPSAVPVTVWMRPSAPLYCPDRTLAAPPAFRMRVPSQPSWTIFHVP